MYSPERKGYYYHAWVLAYNGSAWLPADPAWGLFPASRDRIPLIIDDTGEKAVGIAKIIGRIRIEYINKK